MVKQMLSFISKLIGSFMERAPPPSLATRYRCPRRDGRSSDGHANVAEATAPGRPPQPGGHRNRPATPQHHHEQRARSCHARQKKCCSAHKHKPHNTLHSHTWHSPRTGRSIMEDPRVWPLHSRGTALALAREGQARHHQCHRALVLPRSGSCPALVCLCR